MAEESRRKAAENFEKRMKGEDISPYPLEIRAKDGKTLYVEINARPLEENGEIVGEIGIARDITERKGVEEELRTRIERDRKLFAVDVP